MGTLCWAQGSSAGPVPALATLAHAITTGLPAMLTMRHTTLSAFVPLDMRVRSRVDTMQQECDPQTGTCLHCRDHTSGRHCER